MIYFSSDLHFCHNKSFLYEPRGFNSIEEHDKTIIDNWNSIVTNDDEVYLLGDIMLNDNEKGLEYLQSLNGKIHIICGNHDSESRIELYRACSNIVEIVYATMIKIGKQNYYLSHYPTLTANYDDKPYHSHIISLSGHTHKNDKFHFEDNPFCYNVALDAHNNYPISIEQISEDIHNKVNELYKEKIRKEKELKEYYENGLGYFEKHHTGKEIID